MCADHLVEQLSISEQDYVFRMSRDGDLSSVHGKTLSESITGGR